MMKKKEDEQVEEEKEKEKIKIKNFEGASLRKGDDKRRAGDVSSCRAGDVYTYLHKHQLGQRCCRSTGFVDFVVLTLLLLNYVLH